MGGEKERVVVGEEGRNYEVYIENHLKIIKKLISNGLEKNETRLNQPYM